MHTPAHVHLLLYNIVGLFYSIFSFYIFYFMLLLSSRFKKCNPIILTVLCFSATTSGHQAAVHLYESLILFDTFEEEIHSNTKIAIATEGGQREKRNERGPHSYSQLCNIV